MGVDLLGRGSNRFYCNWQTWNWHLRVAFEHGWHPRGTRAGKWVDENGEPAQGYSEDWDWDGTYFRNAGQWVEREDAIALADALERLVRDEAGLGPNERGVYRDFIEFCRLGEFSIW